MWAHAINCPVSGSGIWRYIVAQCNTPLPVQYDIGSVTPRSREANIEKALSRQIRSRKDGRKRRPYNDARAVESQVSNGWRGYQHRRRNRNCCLNWEEIARVVRFNFMCSHTINGVAPGNRNGRDIMAHRKASLPIQDDVGGVTSGTRKANVEKCLRCEIGA